MGEFLFGLSVLALFGFAGYGIVKACERAGDPLQHEIFVREAIKNQKFCLMSTNMGYRFEKCFKVLPE